LQDEPEGTGVQKFAGKLQAGNLPVFHRKPHAKYNKCSHHCLEYYKYCTHISLYTDDSIIIWLVATGMRICVWALLVILVTLTFYLFTLKYIVSDLMRERDREKANFGENIP
jgi:ABC-type nickel/cobalt efflux system permease component RcnA